MSDRIAIHHGDSRQVLLTLADCSVDSCVTDPPYALVSIGKRFGADNAAPAKSNGTGVYKRASSGFMGQKWDNGETAFDPEFWREVLRALKPGAHLVAFGGTRTYHRLACAIEDGGFEIRDQIGWAFGSGFPKSHNAGNGWGTALKPAWEPLCLARKPLSGTVAENVLGHGTGAINIDGCRVECVDGDKGEWPITQRRHADVAYTLQPVKTEQGKGRWPANVIHDGSEEVVAAFPDCDGAVSNGRKGRAGVYDDGIGAAAQTPSFADSGSAARFFYTAKADSDDRLGSKHPTVKPVDLMQYLVRLVTPKGGLVLDPFAGTGTTGEAAFYEGMRAVLIEREARYVTDIRRRVALLMAGPDERLHASIKASGRVADPGPLFAGDAA